MKICVIGLGRFGYQVATKLAENGVEVLAVDSNEEIIASIRDHVTQAICMHAHDEESLRAIGVDEMDVVVVGMGENFAQSILVTAIAKKRLRIPRVITRSVSDIHKEILKLIGADEIILPERQVAIQLADQLSSTLPDFTRLSKNFAITKLTPPEHFIGKSLEELNLPDMLSLTCVGIEKKGEVEPAHPHYVVGSSDWLVVAGTIKNLERLMRI